LFKSKKKKKRKPLPPMPEFPDDPYPEGPPFPLPAPPTDPGGGGEIESRDDQRLQKAIDLALEALTDNENCKKLFDLTGSGYDPVTLLTSLRDTGAFGLADLGPGITTTGANGSITRFTNATTSGANPQYGTANGTTVFLAGCGKTPILKQNRDLTYAAANAAAS